MTIECQRQPAPVEMFVDRVNAELGVPAHDVDWKTSGQMPQR